MNAIEVKLGRYSDRELAFLYKFQLLRYLPETQSKIKNYIHINRGLSEQKIEQLLATISPENFDHTKPHCPRCKSYKLLSDKIGRASDGHVIKVVCEVCGYILVDPEIDDENIFGHLLDIIPDS